MSILLEQRGRLASNKEAPSGAPLQGVIKSSLRALLLPLWHPQQRGRLARDHVVRGTVATAFPFSSEPF